MMKWWWIGWLLLLTACGQATPEAYEPTLSRQPPPGARQYVVGIHPLHNPQRLMELYGPIIDRIDAAMPEVEIRLEAARNYEEYEKKLYAGYFDFALPNPYQTVLSLKHGYRVFGKMADDADFRGLILLRRDSPVRSVSDLKGQKVAYPAATALAATLLPQHYLQTHGLDINRDIENLYVGSQESSIVNVLRGHVAAAATWSVPWKSFRAEHPEQASQLEVKWQTEPLLNNGWVVRQDVSEPLARRFAELLFDLQGHEAGRQLLARLPVSHFEPATNDTYRPVRAFLENFSRTVRPIEH